MTTEADYLLKQGISQYQTSQFEYALQSWQQALSLYRASFDLRRQGAAFLKSGAAYQVLGFATSDRIPGALERSPANQDSLGGMLLNLGNFTIHWGIQSDRQLQAVPW